MKTRVYLLMAIGVGQIQVAFPERPGRYYPWSRRCFGFLGLHHGSIGSIARRWHLVRCWSRKKSQAVLQSKLFEEDRVYELKYYRWMDPAWLQNDFVSCRLFNGELRPWCFGRGFARGFQLWTWLLTWISALDVALDVDFGRN